MKIAIYSCVIGGYDTIRPPCVKEECDYYMISDDPQMADKAYAWVDVDSVVPDRNMSAKDKNRYCKLHPDVIFPEYDYTIYLDGSIQIVKPIIHYIDFVGSTGLAIHRHRERDCVYLECIFLYWLGVVGKEEAVREAERYIRLGIPRHYGLFECGMIVTELHNEQAIKIYRNWYEEYKKGIKRDQLALISTLWNMKLKAEDLSDLGRGKYNILTNPDISWNRGAHYNNDKGQ